MANVIVGIHGLANKPEPQVLSDWWEKSIREGLKNRGVDDADFRFVMVHWAQFLYKNVEHQDPDFDFDPLYMNQPYLEADPDDLKEYKRGMGDRVREWATDRAGTFIEKIRGPLFLSAVEDQLLESKARDLDFYYSKDQQLTYKPDEIGTAGERGLAGDVLRNELSKALLSHEGDRIMLIAHSMGTIISYDVLRNLGHPDTGFRLAHFVTIGSPLGITSVKARIHSDRHYADVPVRTPSVITERWVNYADPADIVAVDPTLKGDYDPNDAGIQVKDDLIYNSYRDSKKDRKPHKSFGYLRTPELSDHIKDFLGL